MSDIDTTDDKSFYSVSVNFFIVYNVIKVPVVEGETISLLFILMKVTCLCHPENLIKV